MNQRISKRRIRLGVSGYRPSRKPARRSLAPLEDQPKLTQNIK